MTATMADGLAQARLSGSRLAAVPGPAPADWNASFALQDAVTDAMGLPVAGWKIGATSARAQAALDVDHPFWGPLFDRWIYAAPCRVPMPKPASGGAMNLIEAEFAFRMGRDLPARPAPYSVDEVAEAVETLHPAIEIVDVRLEGGFSVGVKWLIADGGANHAFVHGPGIADWRDLDLAALGVRVTMAGKDMGRGTGVETLGGPLQALHTLAEGLRAQDKGLKAGDWVSTGVVAPFFPATLGAPVVAAFDRLGTVEVVLT
jgi:2-keto-4-pentenoate hydratase